MANKALLVGINAYPSAPLSGCVNDVNDMANFLVQKCGFKSEEIRLLVDARATTAAIIERLNWLVQCKSGDKIFFHYSGHGVQVPTRNRTAEIDGLLEAICPVEFDWTPARMITDKQFVSIFCRIPAGVKFNWFSDSCHSGDLDRAMPGLGNPGPKNGMKILGIRRYPVPADIAWQQRVAMDNGIQSRGFVNGKLDVGFVSGCKSNQTSADASFKNRANGAFTYFLLKNLKTGVPLSQITEVIKRDLRNNRFSQQPVASGARASKPFLA